MKDYKLDIAKRFIEVMKWIVYKNINGVTTEGQFAESVGEYQQNISLIRHGRRYPTLNTIVLLHKIYGVPLDWIMLGKGRMATKFDK